MPDFTSWNILADVRRVDGRPVLTDPGWLYSIFMVSLPPCVSAFEELAYEPGGATPEAFSAEVANEVARLRRLIMNPSISKPTDVQWSAMFR